MALLRSLSLLLLAAALLPPALAQAGAALCPQRAIRYAHYEFGLLYAAGQGGIDEDIRQELARRSGCRFEVSVRPRARIWMELERGELDMAGSGVQTAQRDRYAWFAHYVLEDNRMLLAPSVPATVNSLQAFAAQPALRLGAVRSFSYSPYYDGEVERLQRQGRLHATTDTRSLFRLFSLGQVDALIASPFLTLYYTQQLGIALPRIEDWDPGAPTPSGLVLAKRGFTPEQARAWQALVRQLLDDGTVKRILQRHLGDARLAEAALYRAP